MTTSGSQMAVTVRAPARTVAGALAENWLLAASLRRCGVVVRAGQGQLTSGVVLASRLRLLGPVGLALRLRCVRADERGVCLVAWGRLGWRLTAEVTAVGVTPAEVGSRLRISLLGPGSRGRWAARLVSAVASEACTRAEQLSGAPVVVGTAVVVGGAVLAAQRDRPVAVAGQWEFPGGKVEPDEHEHAAVVRECQEELAVTVRVTGRLGPDLVLPNGWLLRIYTAELPDGQRPVAGEHRALRWVTAVDLDALNWLAADRVVLASLRMVLASGVSSWVGSCIASGG